MRAPLALLLVLVGVVALPARAQSVPQEPPADAQPAADTQEAQLPAADTQAPQPPAAEPQAPQPAAADVQPAAADAQYELSAAELAQLGLSETPEGEAPVDTDLKLYGFVDFSMQFIVGSEEWRAGLQRYPSFFIGNFNLYISKNITESIRMFSEVRLLYLPNGSAMRGSPTGEFVTTSAYDYADALRQLRWGGIEIERVYLEWAMHPRLSLRAGQFLTPYGIWNVDHGSPTVIPVARPFIIGQALFPERQTGLELLGQVSLSASHRLGYHLTLSNGSGPVSEYRDLDANKALGARLFWQWDGFGTLRVGVSGYYGRETNSRDIENFDAQGKLEFRETILQQSDVLSLAGDLQWRYENFLLQAELITQQRKFTKNGRGGSLHRFLGTFVAPKDTFAYGSYALLGYRFKWLGIMPYAVLSSIDFVDPDVQTLARAYGFTVGLNIRAIESVVLKLDYTHAWWPDGFIVTDDPTQTFNLQLAWAF